MLVLRDILHFVSAIISLSLSDFHEARDEHVKVSEVIKAIRKI